VDVNLVRKQPQQRRRHGRPVGRIQGYKKAYVTLAPGEKIEFFEGV
jgi:large subunit ribosomal protein L23